MGDTRLSRCEGIARQLEQLQTELVADQTTPDHAAAWAFLVMATSAVRLASYRLVKWETIGDKDTDTEEDREPDYDAPSVQERAELDYRAKYHGGR